MRSEAQTIDVATPLNGSASPMLRLFTVALIAFLTLVDLFAAQAVLPALAKAYGIGPASMGVAVNASTFGMALAGLAVAAFSRHIDRPLGVVVSLALLAIPTALLATLPDLALFTVLRVVQGLFMAAAFSLTLAYLAENSSARETASALAAYVTGNVASNLFGRLISASAADHLGLPSNFAMLAGLNLLGAVLAYVTLTRMAPAVPARNGGTPVVAWLEHLRNGPLCAAFAIGFCILFAFIGIFTYVNFVLTRPPLSLGMMQLGLVYFVFLPSILTTPLAGRAAARCGTRATIWGALAIAAIGLPLLVTLNLPAVLLGLVLVGVGTFFAQAAATGFVGRAATGDRGSAGGFYLASYFCGGLVGSVVLGRAFDSAGWSACVAGVGAALAAAGVLAFKLRLPGEQRAQQ